VTNSKQSLRSPKSEAPSFSEHHPLNSFRQEQLNRQKLINQRLKAQTKQREATKHFWDVLQSQVTKEVVKINLERDDISKQLATYGRQISKESSLVSGTRFGEISLSVQK